MLYLESSITANIAKFIKTCYTLTAYCQLKQLDIMLLTSTYTKHLILLRFPLSILCSVIMCVLLLARSHGYEVELTYVEVAYYSYLWFIASKLFAESTTINALKRHYYIWSIAIFFCMAYYTYKINISYDSTRWIKFILFTIGFCTMIAIAPFTSNSSTPLEIWAFNLRLVRHLLFAMFITIIISISVILLILCIKFLLNIDLFNTGIGLDLIFITIFGCGLNMILSGVPKSKECAPISSAEALTPSIISEYVLTPFLSVYSIVLYLYGWKILYNWTLPKGVIVNFVSLFGVIGIINYLITDNVNIVHYKLTTYLRRYFFYILIMPVACMTIAIWQRINQYGITELRYLVCTIALWLMLIIFFCVTSKCQYHSRIICATTAVLAALTAIGPWSVYNIAAG